jgi:hypothetical protein
MIEGGKRRIERTSHRGREGEGWRISGEVLVRRAKSSRQTSISTGQLERGRRGRRGDEEKAYMIREIPSHVNNPPINHNQPPSFPAHLIKLLPFLHLFPSPSSHLFPTPTRQILLPLLLLL